MFRVFSSYTYKFFAQALFILLPFSYYPLLSFGSVNGMHIDISLLYVALAFAALTGSYLLVRKIALLRKYTAHYYIACAFAIWLLLSCLWSPNSIRAIATAAFFCALCATWFLFSHIKSIFTPQIVKVIISVYLFSCLWALWQIFGDAHGIPAHLTLLRDMYQSQVFGFARPMAFSLEPQFFASLLLIPIVLLSGKLLQSTAHRQLSVFFILLVSVFFLTLSRGALYALLIALIILCGLMVAYGYTSLRRIGLLLGLLCISLIITITTIYTATQTNTHHTISGFMAVSKSINQLTLGTISLPAMSEHQPESKPSSHVDQHSVPAQESVPPSAIPHPSEGYVTESTNSRLSMSRAALQLWTETPRTFLFGVGAGGFGAALHQHDKGFGIDSIVNNYYLETAVETGIVGISLLAALLIALGVSLYRKRFFILLALLIAFCTQWMFFSGNANVIHVWVSLGIFAAIIKNKSFVSLKSSGIMV